MTRIVPIKDLKNTSEISEMCHSTDEPIFITKNGYGDMVIMSLETYETKFNRLNMYKDLEISEQQILEGKVQSIESCIAEIKAKYGI